MPIKQMSSIYPMAPSRCSFWCRFCHELNSFLNVSRTTYLLRYVTQHWRERLFSTRALYSVFFRNYSLITPTQKIEFLRLNKLTEINCCVNLWRKKNLEKFRRFSHHFRNGTTQHCAITVNCCALRVRNTCKNCHTVYTQTKEKWKQNTIT